MGKNKCQYCPKKFQSINDLDRHLQKIHGLSHAKIRVLSDTEKSEQQSIFVRRSLDFLEEKKHEEVSNENISE